MLRKSLGCLFTILIVLFFVIGLGDYLFNTDRTLSIQNNTNTVISGLKIKYSDSFNETDVPEILPGQTYEDELILPDEFTSGSIWVYYTDKQGENHEEYLVGYVERGFDIKIQITIDSIDNNGILTMNIIEKTKAKL